jgi:hypothetical protein
MRPLLAALALCSATSLAAQDAPPRRPVATYSIVARDSVTGEIGVAVQSHWFSVGSVVPWAEAGIGAVATQSFVDPRYGTLGLELMRLGRSAPEALRALVTSDADSAVRQVAMLDVLAVFRPRSILQTVSRRTPATSASCAWVSPAAVRRRRISRAIDARAYSAAGTFPARSGEGRAGISATFASATRRSYSARGTIAYSSSPSVTNVGVVIGLPQ